MLTVASGEALPVTSSCDSSITILSSGEKTNKESSNVWGTGVAAGVLLGIGTMTVVGVGPKVGMDVAGGSMVGTTVGVATGVGVGVSDGVGLDGG